MKPARFGLTFAILSALASLLLLTWILLSLISFKTAENNIYVQKRDEMRLVLSSALSLIPDGTEFSGALQPHSALTRFCERLSRESQFAGLVLMERDGHPVYQLGKFSTSDRIMHQAATNGEEAAQFMDGRHYLAMYLPIVSSGKPVGAARLVFSLSAEHDRLRKSRNLFLAYFVLDFLLLLGLGSWLLSRIVMVPITRLLAATRKVADGDYSHHVHVPGCAEFADLAESFNSMVSSLKDKQIEVERHVASLESTNSALAAAREETLHSEKMASVGLLAAGMAHEIGTPLASIMGYASLLRDELHEDSEKADYLRRVLEDAARIDRIIHGLLDYARPAEGIREQVDLAGVMSSTIELVQHQGAFKGITVTYDCPGRITPVYVDPNQLQQVFINLLINARDAMPEGGTLKVAIRDNGFIRSNVSSQPAVCIEICDSGQGIPPELLTRIFEPFFTTKEPGKGTGLGLAISARIVESFGGKIEVESTPGSGTCFRILLPVSPPELSSTAEGRDT